MLRAIGETRSDLSGRFEGKVAVITGAASGIGEAIVRQLAFEGARVFFCDLNAALGETLCRTLGAAARFRHLDVGNAEGLEALIEDAVFEFGRLDVLCNNAGMSGRGNTLETDLAQWRHVMSVDLDAVFVASRAAIPHMQRSGGGAIVNTASIAGMGGYFGMAAYSAAKGAVVNYTRSLAIDHARDNIRVNAICPGLVETTMTARHREDPDFYGKMLSSIPLARAAQPSEIAKAAAFLASDDASYITGCILPIDGGTTAAVRKGSANWSAPL
jgi:meso-butanediol dehydrogenase/(S,S)-butanediol dehydrogenase/diacetyl reductase